MGHEHFIQKEQDGSSTSAKKSSVAYQPAFNATIDRIHRRATQPSYPASIDKIHEHSHQPVRIALMNMLKLSAAGPTSIVSLTFANF